MKPVSIYLLQCAGCGFRRCYMIVPEGTITVINRDAADIEMPEPVQALPRHCPHCRHKLKAPR